jgi:uncharacterized phage infection (PIP) family protein YhgE
MPLQHCTVGNKPAWRWGDAGKAYAYDPGDKASLLRAKKLALQQGLAMGGGTLQETMLADLLQERTPGIRRALRALAAAKRRNKKLFQSGAKEGFEAAGKKLKRKSFARKIGGVPDSYQECRPTPGGQRMEDEELTEQVKTEVDFRESLATIDFEPLQEGTKRVDQDTGLVRGVKVLGRQSANGRYYSDAAVANVRQLTEGMKVGVDHIDPATKRRVLDTNGFLCNIRENKGGLFGDWRYNPHHPATNQILWDAENNPSALGFSIDARGRTSPSPEHGTLVEEVVKIRSVDLVSDPATNTTLFESKQDDLQEGELLAQLALDESAEKMYRLTSKATEMMRAALRQTGEDGLMLPVEQRKAKVLSVLADWENETRKLMSSASDGLTSEKKEPIMEWKDLTLDTLRKNRVDLVEAILDESETLQLVEQRDEQIATLQEAATKAKADSDAALAALKARVDEFETKERLAQTEREIHEDLEKVGMVGTYAPSDTFLTILREAKDRTVRQAIIKDRSETIQRVTKPISADLPIPICESRQQAGTAGAVGQNTAERVSAWRD